MIEELPFTIGGLRGAYAGGLAPAAVAAEALRRIEAAADPGVFLHVETPERLRGWAEELGAYDPARPLWGVPFAVKDNIDVGGSPTTAGCPSYAYVPERDAAVVARLRAAGALPVGKTNLDQFATGLVGVRTPYPVPRNPLDPDLVPGGSSSGSAVAVARGIVGFALGTDTAGSGRVPAALNNVVGLKPSLGAISTRGVVPACASLDAVSVFALTVDDAYAVFRAAAGLDPEDPWSREVAVGPLLAPPPRPVVGVPSRASARFFGDALQERMFAVACESLARLGAELREVDFEPFHELAALLYEVWVAERLTVAGELLARDPTALLPVTRAILAGAARLSAADAFRGFQRLEALRRQVAPVLAAVDLLCVPSIPTFYTVEDLARDGFGPNARLGTYTNFVNLLGLCGLAVPTPARADGRPGSVTLLAEAGRDGLVAALGRRIERLGARTLGATGWPMPPAAPVMAVAGADEIALAVCGAHMSGLALNGELTRLGAHFLREARTAACYRLYALAGGPPRRPGMVRVADGGGAIRVEVWALPKARVGELLAGIPAPLGLGTVELGDGTRVTGFLCEAAGLTGATDVTAIGDWRRVIAEAAA